ncbi:MAG: signal peptidase II [Acidobacteria bacterium]|nr:signal peptidase II [Acidobacteriota bacterium]
MSPRTYAFALAGLVVLVDQATKLWASTHWQVPVPVIPGFFRLALSHNTGALFGLFAGLGDPWRSILLTAVPAVAVLGIVYLIRQSGPGESLSRIALALILGGAVGNVLDRITYGHVIDFIDVYWSSPPLSDWLIETLGTNRWPTFNVADMGLTVGAVLLVFEMIFHRPGAEKKDDVAPVSD